MSIRLKIEQMFVNDSKAIKPAEKRVPYYDCVLDGQLNYGDIFYIYDDLTRELVKGKAPPVIRIHETHKPVVGMLYSSLPVKPAPPIKSTRASSKNKRAKTKAKPKLASAKPRTAARKPGKVAQNTKPKAKVKAVKTATKKVTAVKSTPENPIAVKTAVKQPVRKSSPVTRHNKTKLLTKRATVKANISPTAKSSPLKQTSPKKTLSEKSSILQQVKPTRLQAKKVMSQPSAKTKKILAKRNLKPVKKASPQRTFTNFTARKISAGKKSVKTVVKSGIKRRKPQSSVWVTQLRLM